MITLAAIFGALGTIAGFTGVFLLLWGVSRGLDHLETAGSGLMTVAGLLWLVYNALDHDWPWAVLDIGIVALNGWFWWRGSRRKRGRAKAWLGAKSKAIRDALVRKQREARKPRPVLRPVPGNAR